MTQENVKEQLEEQKREGNDHLETGYKKVKALLEALLNTLMWCSRQQKVSMV